MNSRIKRPKITINLRIGSRKKTIFHTHISEMEDKKTAYNEGRVYSFFQYVTKIGYYLVSTIQWLKSEPLLGHIVKLVYNDHPWDP